MKRRLSVLAIVSIAIGGFAQERTQDDETYYKRWIGCKAPPIHFDQTDRTNFMEATYKGKKVLLYSFDAGNFVRAPDLSRLTDELQSLRRVRSSLAHPFVVIGYSRGVVWNPVLGLKHIPKKLEKASQFPIVNLNNKRDENSLGEPYELLESPGGILIGPNGIICSVFLRNMTESDFKSLDSIPAWKEPERSPPERKVNGTK